MIKRPSKLIIFVILFLGLNLSYGEELPRLELSIATENLKDRFFDIDISGIPAISKNRDQVIFIETPYVENRNDQWSSNRYEFGSDGKRECRKYHVNFLNPGKELLEEDVSYGFSTCLPTMRKETFEVVPKQLEDILSKKVDMINSLLITNEYQSLSPVKIRWKDSDFHFDSFGENSSCSVIRDNSKNSLTLLDQEGKILWSGIIDELPPSLGEECGYSDIIERAWLDADNTVLLYQTIFRTGDSCPSVPPTKYSLKKIK